eukprot:4115056-Alexandrium_andersonii.AAC.1
MIPVPCIAVSKGLVNVLLPVRSSLGLWRPLVPRGVPLGALASAPPACGPGGPVRARAILTLPCHGTHVASHGGQGTTVMPFNECYCPTDP